jgi:hypothetical protein
MTKTVLCPCPWAAAAWAVLRVIQQGPACKEIIIKGYRVDSQEVLLFRRHISLVADVQCRNVRCRQNLLCICAQIVQKIAAC